MLTANSLLTTTSSLTASSLLKQLKTRLSSTALVLALACLPVSVTLAQDARIKIDIDRTIGDVSPLIYGNFLEHLGRAVYGGVYEPGSPLADADGHRTDVIQAAKDLNVTLLRYPGGNFVSNYHWQDGVGPVEDRPTRMELAWSRLEDNRFGTNEFMEFTRKIGAEPYFAVNMGSGTFEEAQQWVEYTNIADGPYFAELRKQHGYEEPWNIKYWSLGNEMDGGWQIGHLNKEDYVKKAIETAKVMRLTDPSIKLIAAGSSDYRPGSDPMGWNGYVLNEMRNDIDYIAIHMYVGNPADDYYNFMTTPNIMDERTQQLRGLINIAMSNANRGDRDPIYVAWDEYNVWYRARGGADVVGVRALEEQYNLEDVLVISGFLNTFIRNADIVKIANMAQLVNVIAPIFTSEEGMFHQTIFYPLQLFAQNAHGTALDVFVDSDTFDTAEFSAGMAETSTRQTGVPYLDVSATYEEDGKVIINVVNRHKDEAISTDILAQTGEFSGAIEVYEVNGPDVKTSNGFSGEPVRTVRKDDIRARGDSFRYSFPAHSFTQLIGRITP